MMMDYQTGWRNKQPNLTPPADLFIWNNMFEWNQAFTATSFNNWSLSN